jgi:hypothetical protein
LNQDRHPHVASQQNRNRINVLPRLAKGSKVTACKAPITPRVFEAFILRAARAPPDGDFIKVRWVRAGIGRLITFFLKILNLLCQQQ